MTQEAPSPIIRILKIGTCPTLSGKGKLEYHIGLEGESEILFRMTANSGGGYFSPEWVSLKAVQAAIDKAPKPLTSFALSMLFRGKSVNNLSFAWACLLAEGLVQRDGENPRVYLVLPPDTFVAEMQKLIDAGTDLKASGKDDVPVLTSKSKSRKQKAETP